MEHHLCQVRRAFEVIVLGVCRLNITECLSCVCLLIIAGDMMLTNGLDDFTFFINLDFSFALTIFLAIVATPISYHDKYLCQKAKNETHIVHTICRFWSFGDNLWQDILHFFVIFLKKIFTFFSDQWIVIIIWNSCNWMIDWMSCWT